MKNILFGFGALALATFPLTGCITLGDVFSVANATVSPTQIDAADSAFDILQTAAVGYEQLPVCTPNVTTICASKAVVDKFWPYVIAGRKERDALKGFSKANGGAAAPVSLLNTLQATIDSLKGVLAANGIK